MAADGNQQNQTVNVVVNAPPHPGHPPYGHQPPYPHPLAKNVGVAYLLWFASFIGFCGLHRIYTGRVLSGLLWFFTVGLCGFGQLVDLFLIPGHCRDPK